MLTTLFFLEDDSGCQSMVKPFLRLRMAYDYRKLLILLGEDLKQKELNYKSCGVVSEADFDTVKSLIVLLAPLYYLSEFSCRDDTFNSVWNQDLLVDYSKSEFDDVDHKFTDTEKKCISDSANSALKFFKKYNESATKNVQMVMTEFFNLYMAINVLARTEGMLLGPGGTPSKTIQLRIISEMVSLIKQCERY